MKKQKLIFLALIAISLLLSFILVGCRASDNVLVSSNISIQPVETELVFTEGERIRWEDYTFNVFVDGSLVDTVSGSQNMFKPGELEKLNNVTGVKSLQVIYKNNIAFLRVTIETKVYIKKFKVTFNAGEGFFESNESDQQKIKVEQISEIGPIYTPIREGFVFAGWFSDLNNAETIYVTGKPIKKDTELFAKWVLSQTFEVEFKDKTNNDGGETANLLNPKLTIIKGGLIELPEPTEKVSTEFVEYRIYMGSQTPTVIVEKSAKITINANTKVVLFYKTKTFTIRYSSSEWTHQFSETIVEYGRVSDIPFFTLPEKIGHQGQWIDTETGIIPDYTQGITRNYNVVAKYERKKYKVSVYKEDQQTINEALNTIQLVSHGDCVPYPYPLVPEINGHSGYWTILIAGTPQIIDLNNYPITSDLKIFPTYVKKTYTLTLNYVMKRANDGYPQHFQEEFVFEYKKSISEDDLVNLFNDRVLNGTSYKGYDAKYFEIKWYTSANHESGKLQNIPFEMPHNNHTLHANAEERNYVVNFVFTSDTGTTETRVFEAPPPKIVGATLSYSEIEPPAINLVKYDIIGWQHKKDFYYYENEQIYNKDDIVFYDDVFYECKNNNVMGKTPPSNSSDEFWENLGSNHPYEKYHLEDNAKIEIKDFREFNSDSLLDRAFYPIVTVKKYNVSFYTWQIVEQSGSYVINKAVVARDSVPFDHGDSIKLADFFPISALGDYDPPFKPSYPNNAQESDFKLLAWYTDKNFKSEAISPDQDFEINKETSFYAYWTDLLAGTEGLTFTVFDKDESNNPISYAVSGFSPLMDNIILEEMIIPKKYQGKPVVAMSSNLFASQSHGVDFKEIFIPSTITTIGENVFVGAKMLEKINVSDESQHFKCGDNGELVCKNVLKLYCVPSKAAQSNGLYFVPDSIVEIVSGAFANCINVETIEMADSSSLNIIGKRAFSGCVNLKTINLPNSLTTINELAFEACYSLEQINITINNNLKYVGKKVFSEENPWYAQKMEEEFITLGGVLIAYNQLISSLENILVPDEIKSIADSAFDTNVFTTSSIKKIEFSTNSQILYIGNNAFSSNNLLTEIVFNNNSKVTFTQDTFKGTSSGCVLKVLNSILQEYSSDLFVTNYFEVNETLIGI